MAFDRNLCVYRWFVLEVIYSHPVAANMISWAKFHLYWWSAGTHYFNTQNQKNPYIQKITSVKCFLKAITVLVRRWQRQAAAVDQHSLGHRCISSWSLDDGLITCRLLVVFAISLQGEHDLRYLLFVNKTYSKLFPEHMQHSFFPHGGINPLQNSYSPTHSWCSLMTSRESS